MHVTRRWLVSPAQRVRLEEANGRLAIGYAELPHHRGDVRANSDLRQHETLRDLAGREAVAQEPEHFPFAARQPRAVEAWKDGAAASSAVAELVDDAREEPARDRGLPFEDVRERRGYAPRVHVLQQVARRSGA